MMALTDLINCLSNQLYHKDYKDLSEYERINTRGLLSDLFQRKLLSLDKLFVELI